MIEVASLHATVGLDATAFDRGVDHVKAGLSESARMMQDAARYMDDYNKRLAAGIDPAQQLAAVKRQEAALTRELTGLQIRLAEARAGESKIVQEVGARYNLLSNARRAELIEVKQQIAAQEQLARAEAAAAKQRAQAISGAGLSSAGMAGSVLISAPVIGAGVFAVKAALDVQTAMNLIRSETGATGQRLDQLGSSFKTLAGQVPNDMDQVAKAVAVVAQRTGLSGQALNDFTRQELTLARITGSDVVPLITQTTQIFHQWGVATKDQSAALDQLFRAHQVTGIGVKQLQDQIIRFGPTLKNMGLSLAESEAFLGTFGKEGDKTEKIVLGLNTAFAKWAKAGISDLHGALANTITAIQKAPSAFAALKIATDAGFSARGGADFVNAVRTGGFAFEQFVKKIQDGKDTIAKAGDDTLTFSGQFKILEHQIDLAAEPLGRFIAGGLKDLGKALTDDTPKLIAFAKAFDQQSRDAKKLEVGIPAIVAGVPLFLLGLGKAVQGWEKFSGTLSAGFTWLIGRAEAAWTAITTPAIMFPVLAGAALVAFIAAYATNFDGLRDRLIDGWDKITQGFTDGIDGIEKGLADGWARITGGIKSFFEHFRQIGLDEFKAIGAGFLRGVGIVGDNLARGWAELLRRLHGGAAEVGARQSANLARLGVTEPPVTPQGIAASGFAAHLGNLTGPPVLPPVSSTATDRWQGTGESPNLKAQQQAQKDAAAAQALLSHETQIATLLKQGYNRADADFVAAHPKIHGALLQQILALHRQNEAREALNTANKQAQKIADELAGKNRDLERQIQGGGRSRVAATGARVEGADPAHQALVQRMQSENDQMTARLRSINTARAELATIEHRERALQAGTAAEQAAGSDPILARINAQIVIHKAALLAAKEAHDAAAKAVRDHDAAVKAFNARLGTLDADYLKITHGSMRDQLALASSLHVLYSQLPKDLQALIDKEVERTRRNESALRFEKEESALLDKVTTALKETVTERSHLLGNSRELTSAEQILNEAWASGNDELLQMALALEGVAKSNDALKIAQTKAKLGAEEQAQAFKNLFAQLEQHQRVLKDLDLEYLKITHGSLKDQIALNSEYATTYDKLPAAIQKWVDAQVKGIEKIHQATTKLDFLRQFADGTRSVFENMFQGLMEHGFKGFFKNVIDGFSKLMQQMAAQYLASKLTDLIFGKADAQGYRGTQGSTQKSGASLIGLIGGLFSGGGGGGVSGADWSHVFGMAGGGAFTAGVPFWAGERGKELVFPNRAGTVMPHAQSMALTQGRHEGTVGSSINVTMNIHTTDAASFRAPHNQQAIFSDLHRQMERARRRG